MPGCRGRSPRRNKLWVSPFPVGEERSTSAGRGDILPLRGRGAEKQAKGRGGKRPTRQAPLGHHSGRDSQCRHARTQAKAGTGRERRLPPIIIRSRKVLGGLGDSFKSPPAHPRILVSPSPPVRHGDGGRGCRSRRSGRRRGGGRRQRRPRGQRRGGRGTGRSRPCRRGRQRRIQR